MVKKKVLAEYKGDSEWAAPTFGVPKKNGGVRIVTDLRRLNEMIKRNPRPIPTIQKYLNQCGGMTYVRALDIVQLYYTMNIKNTMHKYLVIILPWEKYVYLKIPMGLNISAEISQRKLSRLFQGMPFVLVYIDDINQRMDFNFETHRLIIKTKTKRQRKK